MTKSAIASLAILLLLAGCGGESRIESTEEDSAGEAVERARGGGGPSAIEVDTCRFYGHHSGDAQLYRGKDEVRRLREDRDCLKHFRRRVGEAALLEMAALDAVDAEVAALIDRAVEMARAAPPPAEADLLSDVYASY